MLSSAYPAVLCQVKLEVEGAIQIQDTENTTPKTGTIRWNGEDFQGWNGQRWVSLTNYATVSKISDVDGNIYNTTRIGNQEWMVENLRVTKYNDTSEINQITDDMTWEGLLEGAWSYYDNDSSHEYPYGKLYNWHSVEGGKLCPSGWHIPTLEEWTTLTDHLGGTDLAGGRMKDVGTTYWQSPNDPASNESGFTALPSGYRSNNGTFDKVGFEGGWWSSTISSSDSAWQLQLDHLADDANYYTRAHNSGFSVRCVRD